MPATWPAPPSTGPRRTAWRGKRRTRRTPGAGRLIAFGSCWPLPRPRRPWPVIPRIRDDDPRAHHGIARTFRREAAELRRSLAR